MPHAYRGTRVIARLLPRSISQPSPNRYVIDFGQEISGWVRLSSSLLSACYEGDFIVVRHAETLLAPPLGPDNGGIYVANLDAAAQVDRYTCGSSDAVSCDAMGSDACHAQSGDGWAPSFTFHGFR